MADKEALVAAVEAQGLSIRDLKKAKAPKGDITAAVAALLELKAKYQEVTGEPFPAPAKAAAERQWHCSLVRLIYGVCCAVISAA